MHLILVLAALCPSVLEPNLFGKEENWERKEKKWNNK